MYPYQRLLFEGVSKMRSIPPLCKRIHLSVRFPSDAQSPEVQGFKAVYPTVLNDLTTANEHIREIPYAVERITELLNYTLEDANVYLMIAITSSYRAFATTPPSEEDMKLVYIMSWCFEMARTSIIMADDVLDNSPTRRNRPAWHTMGDNAGAVTYRDYLIISQCIYSLMKTHFHDKSYYWDTVDTMSQSLYTTALGQVADVQVMKMKNLDYFTIESFRNVATYKTVYELWYSWITVGMQMSGISREMQQKIDKVVFDITCEMAILYQALDDYMDCYNTLKGPPGTDIQCGKLTWLMCKAVEMANPQQRSILEKCSGVPGEENIAAVMNVYDELGLKELFKQHYADALQDIKKRIEQAPEYIPKEIFNQAFERAFCNRT